MKLGQLEALYFYKCISAKEPIKCASLSSVCVCVCVCVIKSIKTLFFVSFGFTWVSCDFLTQCRIMLNHVFSIGGNPDPVKRSERQGPRGRVEESLGWEPANRLRHIHRSTLYPLWSGVSDEGSRGSAVTS